MCALYAMSRKSIHRSVFEQLLHYFTQNKAHGISSVICGAFAIIDIERVSRVMCFLASSKMR
jgi:hypothetical protein